MTDPRPPARPIYLDLGSEAVFSMYHAPLEGPTGTAVLICPPWGWDDVSSYRVRRGWADELAAAGHPTLRIDLPGTGDSGGSAADPGRLAAATEAVSAAASWLRTSAGSERVAVIGLGLGGLAAALAVAAAAPIDDLVLWAVPPTGRGLIRQLRAFAALQGSRFSLTGEPEPTVLPDGWLEVNGFVLSAETVAAIAEVRLVDLPVPGLQRALLLEQDGLAVDPDLHGHLADHGVDVTTAPGPGWAAMTFHPERPTPPAEVMSTVAGWLAETPAGVVPLRAPSSLASPMTSVDLDLSVGGIGVRETALTLDDTAGRAFAILTRPVAGPLLPVGAVFLNAGAVRRIGPNRVWVDTARRWAARGIASLRIDLEGIGDSDGDEARYRHVSQFYVRDELGDQIERFIEAFVARGYGPRIVVAGLCAGGYWAFQAAARDRRVTAALMVNPGVLDWHHGLVQSRDAARLRRLRRLEWWRRIVRGQVRASRIRAVAAASLGRAGRWLLRRPAALLRRPAPGSRSASSADILDRLRERDTTVVMAFSEEEPLHAELIAAGLFDQSERWPNLRPGSLPGRDHTLRPISVQQAAHELLDRELDRELERAVAATVGTHDRTA